MCRVASDVSIEYPDAWRSITVCYARYTYDREDGYGPTDIVILPQESHIPIITLLCNGTGNSLENALGTFA